MATQSWRCPFCNHYSTIGDRDITEACGDMLVENKHGPMRLSHKFIVCPNEQCKEVMVSVTLSEIFRSLPNNQYYFKKTINTWALIPESKARSFSPDIIPKAILDDYSEACLIADKSPKASATLSRRCLQGMLRDFWKVKPGLLVAEIEAIKTKTDPDTWEAIDHVRKIGNIGAHMEADINLIVDVDPGEADALIDLIEILLTEWYIAAAKRKAKIVKIKQIGADKEKAKRKSKEKKDEGKNV